MSNNSVITAIARTAIGSFQGVLSSVPTVRLGAAVIKSAVERAGLMGEDIDEVIMGNVLSAGEGQAPARQAAIYAGLPNTVECMTINKVCGSGLKSVMLADQAIRCGDAEVVVAGGMENMSLSPYYLMDARGGMRLGHKKVVDSIIGDGLWDPYGDMHMGNCAEVLAKEENFSREDQDAFAVESYRRSLEAIEIGYFKDEITPVEISQRKGDPIIIDTDEEPGRGKPEKIAKLRTAFEKDGTITAANASSINDGAAALVVMSAEKATELNSKPICKIVAQTSVAHEPLYFTTAPGKAITKVLDKAGHTINDIDLFEINEAFSNVALAAMREHNIPHEKVNIFGGAVSMGHPIGASGARILVTLISALKQKNKKLGLATLCIGGGEAAAVIVEMA
ncbi:MAG: thiolase family protein [Candidatus Marinimicrobia bacterium]|jgi:acetyl-CoA C-acetyltransferase|nr:thiolase family protein [Candidatus Neomarinimicrobiota bacterium]|tara:strand:- start:272 stop:1453 length:1182 start_codon:yes stop_codon:yes gene_type:complete